MRSRMACARAVERERPDEFPQWQKEDAGMRSMNEVTLMGHVGGNPEVRTMPSGDEVANFSLATNERFKNSAGEEVERTEWHRIAAFRGLAKVVREYVRKGDPLMVRGTIRTREWEDSDGAKRQTKEIVLGGPSAMINLLGSAAAEATGNGGGGMPEEDGVPV